MYTLCFPSHVDIEGAEQTKMENGKLMQKTMRKLNTEQGAFQ